MEYYVPHGNSKIGAMALHDRKRPVLFEQYGHNDIKIYATFTSEGAAMEFVNALGEFCGEINDEENS